MQDSDGDENWHVYSVDLKTKIVRDLTRFQGVKAQNLLTSPSTPMKSFVGLNLRVPRVADMYRINLATGAVVLDTENPGDVLSVSRGGLLTATSIARGLPSFRDDVSCFRGKRR